MALTIHEAQITTATVEIQTLTISGKQVTLAVFRQLKPVKHPWKVGTAWGTVNYHPDGCRPGAFDRRLGATHGEHLHDLADHFGGAEGARQWLEAVLAALQAMPEEA